MSATPGQASPINLRMPEVCQIGMCVMITHLLARPNGVLFISTSHPGVALITFAYPRTSICHQSSHAGGMPDRYVCDDHPPAGTP